MKNTIKFLSVILISLSLFSWTMIIPNPSITYSSGEAGNSVILLELNEDGTYTYQDLSSPKKPIKLSGTYIRNPNRIRLESTTSQKFHNHWNISEDGKIAKSRKGLSFYSLMRLD